MILGSKHVGAILNVLYKQFYVCAIVGVLIKCLYEMHGAMIKIKKKSDEVLHGVKGERAILHIRKRGTANFTGHILRRNCLLKCATEGKIERAGRRGRKRKQLIP